MQTVRQSLVETRVRFFTLEAVDIFSPSDNPRVLLNLNVSCFLRLW